MKAIVTLLIGAAIGWVLMRRRLAYVPGYVERNKQANRDACIGWPVADTGYQAGDGWPAPRYVMTWAGRVCE